MFTEEAYLELHRTELAMKHKKLLHDGDTRIAWLGPDDAEDSSVDGKKRGDFMMRMLPVTGKISGDQDYQLNEMRGGFEIIGYMKQSSTKDWRHAEQVRSEALKIGLQLVAKLNSISNGELCDEETCACSIPGFDMNTVTWRPFKSADNAFGYEFTYKLADGEALEYDASAFDEEAV